MFSHIWDSSIKNKPNIECQEARPNFKTLIATTTLALRWSRHFEWVIFNPHENPFCRWQINGLKGFKEVAQGHTSNEDQTKFISSFDLASEARLIITYYATLHGPVLWWTTSGCTQGSRERWSSFVFPKVCWQVKQAYKNCLLWIVLHFVLNKIPAYFCK